MYVKKFQYLIDSYSRTLKTNIAITSGMAKAKNPTAFKFKVKERSLLNEPLIDIFVNESGIVRKHLPHNDYNNPILNKLAKELRLIESEKIKIAFHISTIYQITAKRSAVIIKNFKKAFECIDGVTTESRVKSEDDMLEKIFRKIEKISDRKRELIEQLNTGIYDGNRADIEADIARAEEQRSELIHNFNVIHSRLGDALGTRIIMEKPTTENIEKIVQKLIDGIKKGDFKITEIENYAAANPERMKNADDLYNPHYYFTQSQIDRITKACNDKKMRVKVNELSKPSGYTSTQLRLTYKNGVKCELQIRGNEVHHIAQSEHLLYDIREGKDIAKGNKTIENILDPIYSAIKKVYSTPKLKKSYDDYLNNFYYYKREIELLNSAIMPELSENIPKILDMNNIMQTQKKLTKIKDKLKDKECLW